MSFNEKELDRERFDCLSNLGRILQNIGRVYRKQYHNHTQYRGGNSDLMVALGIDLHDELITELGEALDQDELLSVLEGFMSSLRAQVGSDIWLKVK